MPALDRQDLQQVLLNLISNAVAAMRSSKDRTLRVTGRCEGGAVVIEVADTGIGISPEETERIFEPFFSTKPRGDAIGLGLTTCRKLVAGCGGSISCRSQVGEGATFTLQKFHDEFVRQGGLPIKLIRRILLPGDTGPTL